MKSNNSELDIFEIDLGLTYYDGALINFCRSVMEADSMFSNLDAMDLIVVNYYICSLFRNLVNK